MSRLEGLSCEDYWKKTKKVQNLFSIKAKLIFLWKIYQKGLVEGSTILFTSATGRCWGRSAMPNEIVKNSPALVRKARESSNGVKGARIFNFLLIELRNMNCENVDTFKTNLDTFPLNAYFLTCS